MGNNRCKEEMSTKKNIGKNTDNKQDSRHLRHWLDREVDPRYRYMAYTLKALCDMWGAGRM